MFEINEVLVRKLLATVDAGLTAGLGKRVPGQMCMEAATSYALGEQHSDEPSCVDGAVRAGNIRLSDARWSSNTARATGMRELAIAHLGSAGVVDPEKYARRLAELTIQWILPIALRAAASPANPKLEEAARKCEMEGSGSAAREAQVAAYGPESVATAIGPYTETYTASAAAYAAASVIAYAAEYVDAYGAEYAECATECAATAAAYAAAATAPALSDDVLTLSATLMVATLRECGSPGCDWLWLCEEGR